MTHRLLAAFAVVVIAIGCSAGGVDAGTDAARYEEPRGGGDGGGGEIGGGTGGGGAGGGSGGGDAGIDAAVPPTPSEEFCTAFAKAWCDREALCGFLAQSHRGACESRAYGLCEAKRRLEVIGARGFVPANAQSCLDTVKNDACRTGKNLGTTGTIFTYTCLDAVFGIPSSPIGGPCLTGLDCDAGYCDGVNNECRFCTGYVPLNGICNTDLLCNPNGQYCNRMGGTGDGRCEAMLGLNAGCLSYHVCNPTVSAGCGFADGGLGAPGTCLALFPDGRRCTAGVQCASKYCNANAGLGDAGPNACGFRSLGQRCAGSGDCGPGNYCKGLKTSPPAAIGTCTPRVAPGQSCNYEWNDATDGCADAGFECIGNVCALLGTSPAGGGCTSDNHCVVNTFCAPSTDGGVYRNCRALQPVGQSCGDAGQPQCVTGASCYRGACRALGGANAPCFNSSDCQSFYSCPLVTTDGGNTCQLWADIGSSCNATNTVCAQMLSKPGYCAAQAPLFDGGVPRVCSTLGSNQASCTALSQCASGRCYSDDGGTASTNTPGFCRPACIP